MVIYINKKIMGWLKELYFNLIYIFFPDFAMSGLLAFLVVSDGLCQRNNFLGVMSGYSLTHILLYLRSNKFVQTLLGYTAVGA